MKNEQAKENAAQPGVQPAPANMAQPQMVINPQTGQPYPYAVQPKQPMSPETKKKIIIGCSVGGGVLVLGILAAILLPIILKVDYEESYNLVQTLDDQLDEIAYDSDCTEMRYDFSDSTTSVEKYGEYATNCKTLVGEARATLTQLGASSGVSRDSEVKALYETTRTDFETAFGADDAVFESGLNEYVAVHGFVVTLADIDRDNYTETVGQAAKYLTESGNEALKEFGEKFEKAANNYYKASQEYVNNYSSDSYAAYQSAYDDFSDVRDEAYDLDEKMTTVLGSDEVTAVMDDCFDLWDLLSDKKNK